MQNLLEKNAQSLSEKEKREICLWAKLMGKVCFNVSIKDKVNALGLHEKVWAKSGVFE